MKKPASYLLAFLMSATLLFISVPAQAQQYQVEWTRTFGGNGAETGDSVQQASDGSYVVVGSTTSFGAGGYDVYFLKVNASGSLLWNRTFGGGENDFGVSVSQTTDHGYIIGGRTSASGILSASLVKTDSDGNLLWNKTLWQGAAYSAINSVRATADGGCVAAGTVQLNDTDFAFLSRIGPDGGLLWNRTFGLGNESEFNSVWQTTDGGHVAAGRVMQYADSLFYVVRTDSGGDLLWDDVFGGTTLLSVQQTSDGGYIVGGSSGVGTSGGTGYSTSYLAKLDSDGKLVWGKDWWTRNPQVGLSYVTCVSQTGDGGYIVSGTTANAAVASYVMMVDSGGNQLWNMTFSASRLSSVQQTNDGGYIASGDIAYAGLLTHVLLIKIGFSKPPPSDEFPLFASSVAVSAAVLTGAGIIIKVRSRRHSWQGKQRQWERYRRHPGRWELGGSLGFEPIPGVRHPLPTTAY